ncbi:MAG: hypothetical protein K2O22_05570, partial [Anaeroplasmataceae bacterium]|nr:hypothetical protein [Anaeroplasmataceae bacterium]
MKKRKKDKTYLKLSIMFLLAILVAIALLGNFCYQYIKGSYSYEDLEYKPYSFISYERKTINSYSKEKSVDYIYVKPESKPLTIDSLVRGKFRQEDLNAIQYSDS